MALDVLSADDSVNGQWQYEYGPLNRLIEACSPNCSSPATALQYVYDRFGNRWQENVLAGSGPSAQLTFDANNHITGVSYDSAGDILGEGSQTFTFDGDGRIASADGGSVKYVYDAFGHRVEKITPAGTFYFLHDLTGRPITELNSSGGWWRGEVYAGGRHLATYTNSTVYFDYPDWLGTERMRATVDGYAAATCTSGPFGAGYGCSAVSPMGFTGQVHDSTTGLDHFPARYYTSTWSIWLTPDPLGGHLADPITLDKYVYGGDNPTSLTDPSGLDFYLLCSPMTENQGTCQKVDNGGESNYVQGKMVNGKFEATVISSSAGKLLDQYGNVYSGRFSQAGVGFTSASGQVSGGVFAHGTNATVLSGTGIFKGFTGVFNDNCGGTCVASGSIFGTTSQFVNLKADLLHNPGIDALDIFHGTFFGFGPQNYRYGNPTGPDPHLISRGGTEARGYDQFHFDGRYPYATVPGFLDHAKSALRTIGHLFIGPVELPSPTAIP